MKSAHKWKCAGAIAALGMLITVVPIVAEATPVDPAIIARFKKLAPPLELGEMFHAGDSGYLTDYHHPRLPTCVRAKS